MGPHGRPSCGMLTDLWRRDPTEDWEWFGREEPYFGVWTEEQFTREKLGEEARSRFFASGEQHMDTLLADVSALVYSDFAPERVLEYGCGVGRLLIPAARRARHVVGVDVSSSMLAEARRNCEAFGVSGVTLVPVQQMVGLEPGFDFIYSIAVFQHMPRRAGEPIFATLAGLLRPGGVGALNIVLRAEPHLARFNAVMKVPLARYVRNIARGRPWAYPHMQMNTYDLNRISLVLRDQGVRELYVKVEARSAGFDPCTVFFRR
jgi:SAM-dependent methyltransferase